MIFKLNEFALHRSDVIDEARSYSKLIGEHVIKCVAYNGTSVGKENLHEWSSEIANYINAIGSYSVKTPSGKLSKKQYKENLFDRYANETHDYNARLVNFRARNKNYPDFEVTDNLIKLFQKVFEELCSKTVPMVADKNKYTLGEYQSAVKEVLSNNGIK